MIGQRLLYIMLLNLLIPCGVTAQSAAQDQYQKALQAITGLYRANMADNANLYNGAEYRGHPRDIAGSPYFLSDSFKNGNIVYAGALYTDVPLKYDVVQQKILTKLHQRDFLIQLLNEKISSFTIGNDRFITLDERNIANIESKGFFQLLSEGKVDLLAKRQAVIRTSLNTQDSTKFIRVDKFFIKKDNAYHPVGSRSDVLNILKEERSRLKQFMDKNRLNFKKAFERSLVRVINYYSSIE